MAQTPSRFCPQCGIPVASGQRFCSNCGATMDEQMAHPTERASEGASTILPQHGHEQATFLAGGQHPDPLVPPPPPPGSLTPPIPTIPSQPSSSYTQYPSPAQGGQQGAVYTPAPPLAAGPVPVHAKPQKDSSRSVLGQIGCGVLLVILLIVGLCGGAGYLGYRWVTSQVSSSTSTNTGSTTSNGNENGNSSTPAVQVTTKQINQTITYASDTITIVSVQQASSFSDDNSSNGQGLVRITVKENNASANGPGFAYYNTLRLILPDKSSVAPADTKTGSSPQPQTTQENWWDFPAATNLAVDQMTLLIGSTDQAQMRIPLTGHADLSQYQPKTAKPNAKTQYAGLNWTMTNAVVSFNAVGRQATSGMRYVTITMSVDNNSSQNFNGYWGDYMRLKTGSNSSAPTSDTNFPTGFAAGSTGNTGTLIFLVPEGNTSYTLVLLGNANTSPPISQATIDFQVG